MKEMSHNHSIKELRNLTRKETNHNRNHTITKEMIASKLGNYDLNSSILVQKLSSRKFTGLKIFLTKLQRF